MSMRKIFVLDTSVLIHDPSAVFNFGEHDIVIPLAVITEVDAFKNGNDHKAYSAREFSRIMDSLKEKHETLMTMVPLPEPATGSICVSTSGQGNRKLPPELDERSKDRQIIATAVHWTEKTKDRQVVLVSKDTNVRLLGHACGLITEDYKKGRIQDYTQYFDSPPPVSVSELLIDRLMKEHAIPVNDYPDLSRLWLPNNCLTLIGDVHANKSVLAVVEYHEDKMVLRRQLKDENRLWSLSPRNREQIFASALLINRDIKLVSLLGKAGTGKTLLALAAALEQAYEIPARTYKKIIVMRPVIPVGKDMGWLPGDIKEKIAPWMKPIYDNLSFLNGERDDERKDRKDNENRVKSYFDEGIIEVEPISFVRGRSINDAFIIVDEAQNLTPHELKTVITRAAGNSKVVLTGDLDQIDTPYLDAYSSGLTHVVKKFYGQPIFGSVTLKKGERSELAELAATLL